MAVSSKNFLTGLNGDTKVLVGTDADAEKLEQAISMPAGEALVLTDANKTVKITSDRNVVTELARTYTVTGSVTATGHEYSGKEDSYGNLSSSRNSMMCYVRGVEIVRTSTESNPGKHSLKVRCEYMTNRATFVPFYLPIGPQGSETVDLTVSSEGDFTLVHLANYASNVMVLKYNGHNYATFRVIKEEEGENGFEFTFHLVFDKVFGHEYTEEGYGDYLEVSVVLSRSDEKNVSITKTEKLVVDASPEAFEKVTVAHSQQYKDEYFTKVFPGGQLAFQNPDTGSGEYVSVSFPERSGTVAVADSDGRLGVDVETAMMTETAKSVDGYPEYSEENSYAAGAVVVHDGNLWKCKDGIESGEAWNGSHWTETSVKVMLDSKLGKEGGSLTGPLSVGSVQIHGEGINYNGYEIEFPSHTGTLALSSEVDSKLDAKNGVAKGMVKIVPDDTTTPVQKPIIVFKTDFQNGSGSETDDANISAGYDAEGNKLFLEFHGGENNEWDSRLTPDGTPVMTQAMVSSAIQGKQDSLTVQQVSNINNALTDATAFDTAGAASAAVTNHLSDGDNLHVTSDEKATWSGKQDSLTDYESVRSDAASGAAHAVAGGNPHGTTLTDVLAGGTVSKDELSEEVKASLGKADTALQEHQDVSGKLNTDGSNEMTSQLVIRNNMLKLMVDNENYATYYNGGMTRQYDGKYLILEFPDAEGTKTLATTDEVGLKLGNNEQAADSAKLGGVAASEYAKKSDIKTDSIVKGSTKIDGEGKVYVGTESGNYFDRVDVDTGSSVRYLYDSYRTEFADYKYVEQGGSVAMYYRPSDGGILNQLGSKQVETTKGVDPLSGASIATCETSAYRYVFTPLTSSIPSTPTDRIVLESELTEGLAPLATGSLAGINDYLINLVTVVDGKATLSRDAVNRIDMAGVGSVEMIYPQATGRVRDFLVVFDNVSGSPTVDFGDISIVSDDENVLAFGSGTTVMSFTEIMSGKFMVSKKVVVEVS